MNYRHGLAILERYMATADEESRHTFNLYKSQLLENLRDEERFGPTSETKHSRARIVDRLNPLAERIANTSFTHMCTEQPLPVADSARMAASPQISEFCQVLNTRMDLSEVRMMCFDLNIDPDNFQARSKAEVLREIVVYLARRQVLPKLGVWLQHHRPDIWGDVRLPA